VLRRKWLDEQAYGDLVALCQFLPGPASSQVAFALGVFRGGGLAGGLAAWLAFTLPSALILVAFAFGAAALHGPVVDGVFHGLKLVAVAVVAQAIWGMARTLTPDKERAAVALLAIAVIVGVGGSFGQIASIVLGTLAGLWLCRGEETMVSGHLSFPVSARNGALSLALFAALLVVPSLIERATGSHAVALFDAFYRSGALVFGGGHVVLPLLQTEVVNTGWVTNEAFLQGYGLAQAVPGPLFTFAAYLGSVASSVPNGLAGAAIALVAIFLPGSLLVYGMLPFWDALRSRPGCDARCECGCGRNPGDGSLRSGLEERRRHARGFCSGCDRVLASGRLADAVVGCGGVSCRCWRASRRVYVTMAFAMARA